MMTTTLDEVNRKMLRGDEFILFVHYRNYPITDDEACDTIESFKKSHNLNNLPVLKIQDPEHSFELGAMEGGVPVDSGFMYIKKVLPGTYADEEDDDIFNFSTPEGCSGVEGPFHSFNVEYVKTSFLRKALDFFQLFKGVIIMLAALLAADLIFPSLYSTLWKILTPYGVYNIALLLFVSLFFFDKSLKKPDMYLPRAVMTYTLFWFYIVAVIIGNGLIYFIK